MSEANRPWFHGNLGRMETERLLVDSRGKDGSFLIRPSESMKGAYVLSLIHQQRIHHYRILPNDDCSLSVQAQEGVQQKRFLSLDELVEFYSQPKRGIVCGLTTPIEPHPSYEDLDQQENDDDDDDDDDYDEQEDDEQSNDRSDSAITKYLLAALAKVDLSQVDTDFQDNLKKYLTEDVAIDIDTMSSLAPEPARLKQLLSKEVEKTHKQLDALIAQIEVLQTLLDRVGGAKQATQSTKTRRSSPQDNSFDSVHYKLSDGAAAVQKLETTAFSTYKDLGASLIGSNKGSLSQPASFQGASDSLMNEVSFDVKLEQLGAKKNMCLSVHIKDGKLTISKQGELGGGQTFYHNQVTQLIKSRSKEQKLGVLFEGHNRKDYVFNSMQAREHFCQLIQMIRNKLHTHEDPDSISVFIGTWNMGDSAPPTDIDSWFKSDGWGRTMDKGIAPAHDIYAIGTQESGMGEREWIAKVKSVLKNLVDIEYERVTSQTLWGIRLVILVKPEHTKKISHVEHTQVRTGIGNTLGNKGGVGISFFINNISLGFIAAHLTSGTEKCHRRNQNYHDILKGMATMKHKHMSQFDLTHQFNHLFFFGDLNYRVELDPKDIIKHAQNADINPIYCADQLRGEMEKKKVFVGFEEPPILFPPTYRFRKGERTMGSYVYIKKKRSGDRINEPSFCDRVLWKSYPGSRIHNTSYGCSNNIMTSDHCPVFSTFQIGGFKQHASNKAHGGHNSTFIILQRCSAKILTNSRTHFYIEIHSVCFEGVVKTDPNKTFTELVDGRYLRPEWNNNEPVAKIAPVILEQEYLEQQHILLMLKSTDSDEPYAECCVALGSVINPYPQSVTRELIHQGLSVGEFECMIHVTMDHYSHSNGDTEKDLYGNLDFIRSEVEEITSVGSRSTFYVGGGVSSTGSFHSRPQSGGEATEYRPPLPIPRSGSASCHRPPMPLPSSNFSTSVPDNDGFHRPPMPLPPGRQGSDTLPPVPKRRDIPTSRTMSSTLATSTSSRSYSGGSPPLPTYPEAIPTSPTSATTLPLPPVPRRQNSAHANRPPVSEKPKGCSLSSIDTQRGKNNPPVPTKRTKLSGDSPPLTRPNVQTPSTPSTIQDLLTSNGLQKYTSTMVDNGFDDIRYIKDISNDELLEIGVIDERDRAKLLKVFSSF